MSCFHSPCCRLLWWCPLWLSRWEITGRLTEAGDRSCPFEGCKRRKTSLLPHCWPWCSLVHFVALKVLAYHPQGAGWGWELTKGMLVVQPLRSWVPSALLAGVIVRWDYFRSQNDTVPALVLLVPCRLCRCSIVVLVLYVSRHSPVSSLGMGGESLLLAFYPSAGQTTRQWGPGFGWSAEFRGEDLQEPGHVCRWSYLHELCRKDPHVYLRSP